MSESWEPGGWVWHADLGESCRVLHTQDLWGSRVCEVWAPGPGVVLRVPADRLAPLATGRLSTAADRLVFAVAAARIADVLERDALVAPLQGSLVPLPHQIEALTRAVSGDRVRYLLADEVGLGKTIEAGLILRELKFRGLVRRTLVVAPAGLTSQWVAELRHHFNEDFRLVRPEDLREFRGALSDAGENPWRRADQVVCPLDSVKPLDARRGWSNEQLARANRERFEDLVTAGWDLVIFDEAHRLGGTSDKVARFRLAQTLAQASPYLLLLSATPHQGETQAFRRLISLLDPAALPDDSAVRRENIAPYVIRTEKRRAIDADGRPLFRPRRTQLIAVPWAAERPDQALLYEAVSEYVRAGYDQARRAKRNTLAFLMILMQRLVTSSTAAIRFALEKRLATLNAEPDAQMALFTEEEWQDMDGQEQLDGLIRQRVEARANERQEVETLLAAARTCESHGPDAKAEALREHILRLVREEDDPALKVLVFTEFVPTQTMLVEFLSQRGYPVVSLNGSMDMRERLEVQRAFAHEAQVLVSTDAGGEGLNLQFSHVVVNYDLPWNPMRLEQRIGRVDRIGQKHVVRALNFALEDSVECRVQEVIERKLEVILSEFGVDKLADVLDSGEDNAFDTLYMEALMSPQDAEARAAAAADLLRERAHAARLGLALLPATERLDPEAAQRIQKHPLPFWTERMVLAHLRTERARGAEATSLGDGRYRIAWPDGTSVARATFRWDSEAESGEQALSLEDPKVRGLLARIPVLGDGEPFLSARVDGVSEHVSGEWSLWRVAIQTGGGRHQRFLPVFLADDGRQLPPTARLVWERLLTCDPATLGVAVAEEEDETGAYAALHTAQSQGEPLFLELKEAHAARMGRERRKMRQAFDARRRAIERVGLPEVRNHRLRALDAEERDWQLDVAAREAIVPELSPIVRLRVRGPQGAA